MKIKLELLDTIKGILDKTYGLHQEINKNMSFLDQLLLHILEPIENASIEDVYKDIFDEFVDWNEIRVSSLKEIQEIFEKYLTTNVQEKAYRIKDILNQIYNIYHKLELNSLWDKDVQEFQKFISQLRGVDESFITKFFTRCTGYQSEELMTTFWLITDRIRLWPKKYNKTQFLQDELIKFFGSEEFQKLLFLFYIHGKIVCKPIDYECPNCKISQLCKVGKDFHKKAKNVAETKTETKTPKKRGRKKKKKD